MDSRTPSGHQDLTATEARSGEKTGHVRYILGISLLLVVVAFIVAYLVF